MLGLFIGTVHLFLMLNAGVRSVAGKWWLGAVASAVRIFLLMALAMAGARIRAGDEPTRAIAFALYGGPALTLLVCALAFYRRRTKTAGSDEERIAGIVMKAWLAVGAMDVVFVVLNAVRGATAH